MYTKFYLMQKEPFSSYPLPELFYKSNPHQNCWKYILQGMKKNEQIILVTGEYGAGKTLLSLKLIKLLEYNTDLVSIYISNPSYNFIILIEKILVELKISIDKVNRSNESRLQHAVYEYFEQKSKSEKKYIYIVIDDAQEFSYSFYNKLRLFASYNYSGFFPIRIILFGHHSFFKMLNYKKMAALGQRIKRIYSLKSLNFEETREYIFFRLIYSGATGSPVFDDDAIRLIQTISRGIPRLINNICDNCLLLASSERLHLINQSLVSQIMTNGNLIGLGEIQKKRDKSAHPKKASHTSDNKSPLPEDIVYKKNYAEPANHAYSRESETNSQQQYTDERYRDRDTYKTYNVVAHTGESENRSSEKKRENKSDLKNIGSRNWKKGIIIVLILTILFLLFYLFNQNKSNEMYNLQSRSEHIIKSSPEDLHTIEDSNIFTKNHVITNNDKKKLHEVKKKDKPIIEKQYQPIIPMSTNFTIEHEG